MHKEQWSVAIPGQIDSELQSFLIRQDGQEDLLFALWSSSRGLLRHTALLHSPIYPDEGDRQRHGNVSYNPQYFEKACSIAMSEGCGIAFLHSHPSHGWQRMSLDDIAAEQKMAGTVASLTDLPLL